MNYLSLGTSEVDLSIMARRNQMHRNPPQRIRRLLGNGDQIHLPTGKLGSTIFGASRLPVSAAAADNRSTEPNLDDGDHVPAHAQKLTVFGGCDGRYSLKTLEHDVRWALRRHGAARHYCQARYPRNHQDGPRQLIYESQVSPCPEGPHQHGRQVMLARQRVR